MDVIALLEKDHREVTKLFERFAAGSERGEVVERICRELDVHAQIEEEIFYPAIRQADAELRRKVDESLREHAEMKAQIRQLCGMGRQDAGLESEVTALRESVEHHVTEEEGEMFPRVAEVLDERRRSELGRRLQERKGELTGEGGGTRERRPAARAGRRSTERRRGAKARGRTSRTTTRRRTVSGRTNTRRRTKSAKARTVSSKSRRSRSRTRGRARKTGRRRASGGRSR